MLGHGDRINGHTLADRDGRGVVIQSEGNERHVRKFTVLRVGFGRRSRPD